MRETRGDLGREPVEIEAFAACLATILELSAGEIPALEAGGAVLADAGYWHTAQMQTITDSGIEVLLPSDGNMREGKRRGWEDGLYQAMRDKLTSERGRKLYVQRKIPTEPVFGQIRYNRRIDTFMRTGRAAAQSEWRLVTATHNMLKLHTHWIASTA